MFASSARAPFHLGLARRLRVEDGERLAGLHRVVLVDEQLPDDHRRARRPGDADRAVARLEAAERRDGRRSGGHGRRRRRGLGGAAERARGSATPRARARRRSAAAAPS